jgi:prepilin-type N-terminal cleavage/methylation domain-containing protein
MSKIANKKNKKKSGIRSGVTLVELVTVMAIISIGVSVVLVYLGNARVAKELEAEGRKVAAVIKEAQNYSLTGKNADSCPASPDNNNKVSFTAGGNAYGILNCNVTSYTLSGGVTFANGGLSSVAFTVPHGNVVLVPSNGTFVILTKAGQNYRICINSAGEVNEGC